MSMMRCDNCDRFIDTDFDSEHFEECQAVSNLKRDIEGVLENYHNKLLMTETPYDVKQRDQATTQIINLIESVVDNLKPDTNLLGCDKHWSDDSGGTCTCDENERTAIRFYEKAKDDIKSKLIGKE